MDARTRIPADQVTDVVFVNAVADPVGAAEQILRATGRELTDESVVAMEAWIAQDRKREALPVHRYAAEDFGLDAEQIRDRFAEYRRRFL
jgi:hypothetical protein